MSKSLKPGDKVEVLKVWAATPSGPSYAWTKGYKFISSDGKTTQVEHTEEPFKGCVVNFDAFNVRKDPSDNGK